MTGDIDSTMTDIGLSPSPGEMVDILSAARDELPDLRFVGIHSVTPAPGDLDAALEGTFRHRDERFTLSPPVDWWTEPYCAPNERGFFQNSFSFADPLLADPRFPEVLDSLAAIFADWLSVNQPTGPAHPHRYAWHDHAAAGRLVTIAFTLREGIRGGSLDEPFTEVLAAGVLAHVAYLAKDENHAPNNHGLFCDAALALAARSLEPVPAAREWAIFAERRFCSVLAHTVNREDALHLEHSPYYHWIIHGALLRFAAAGLFTGLDLHGLTRRMEESGAWLVTPEGTLPPFGDTPPDRRPPAAVAARSASCSGMRVFGGAGYAALRDGGNALFVTCAHHPTAHKHADDGSFCLYEDGLALVLDSGDPGYEYESLEFRYGTSPGAHAVVCIDDFDWSKESRPYGSGMVAWAEADGLYALLVRNPGAVRAGGAAQRAFVYAPRRFLLVLDDVDADPEHVLTRHLPLAPGLDGTLSADGEVTIHREGRTVARLAQLTAPGGAPDDVELLRGQRVPEMAGFIFPTPQTATPRSQIRLRGVAGHPRAFALMIGDRQTCQSPAMERNSSATSVEVSISGLTKSALLILIGEDSIRLEQAG